MKKEIKKKKDELQVKDESVAYDLKHDEKEYTYQDILDMNTDDRYEIINGQLYLMGSPSKKHQLFTGDIYTQIYMYLKGKPCNVFFAPSDVKLSKLSIRPKYDKIKDYVQPDIYVTCNKEDWDDTGIIRFA